MKKIFILIIFFLVKSAYSADQIIKSHRSSSEYLCVKEGESQGLLAMCPFFSEFGKLEKPRVFEYEKNLKNLLQLILPTKKCFRKLTQSDREVLREIKLRKFWAGLSDLERQMYFNSFKIEN